MKKLILATVFIVFLFGSLAWADSSSKVQSSPNAPMTIQEGMCTENMTPEMLVKRGCCSWHNGVCGCQNGRLVCCDGTYSPTCRCQSEEVEIPN